MFLTSNISKKAILIYWIDIVYQDASGKMFLEYIEPGMKGCLYDVLLKVTWPHQSAMQSVEKGTSSLIKCWGFKHISCTVILQKKKIYNLGKETKGGKLWNKIFFQLFIPYLPLKKKKTKTGTVNWTDPLLIKSTELEHQMEIDEAGKKILEKFEKQCCIVLT